MIDVPSSFRAVANKKLSKEIEEELKKEDPVANQAQQAIAAAKIKEKEDEDENEKTKTS